MRTSDTFDDDRDITVERRKDLVRWGPVITGLFAALATLAPLTVLGLAIGLSAYDAGDQASSFGIGAGIWGAITALIAFFVGGWLSGRTSALRGTNAGILQGAMVWFVAIPLLLYLLSSGIGALARTAGSVAGTAIETAGSAAGVAAGQAANNPAAQATAQAGAANVGAAAQATATALAGQVTPGRVEQAADTADNAAWGTLLSLGLAAAAAIAGGYAGARPKPEAMVRA
ncbi:MAG: hypothetical protein M3R61_10680 [Chloroflexota bacterium]|nr:hypothetical protein [Chloroflexota bacterium]